MLFNSLDYLLFLPIVYLVFYCAGDRLRWIVLLVASLLFYAALDVPYLLAVLALVIAATYGCGLGLARAKTSGGKRGWLWGGIGGNICILVAMKYLPFLAANVNALATCFSASVRIEPVSVLVAVGVSYYVFQAISYLIDVYLDISLPERHIGYFALYLSFFPKLLQGPIERVGDLLPQLKSRYAFDYDNMRFGMLTFVWGLFKKAVVADRLAPYVDVVYNDVHSFTGLPMLMATYAYAFQIYLDFSGYTDMALGTARMFNINLTQNFKSPYLATSVADFWRRWHISFSRWILDYIFKPLQMGWRNWQNWGTAAALLVTFLVSGIWHGASWGFVIWGLLHGIYLAGSVFYRPYQKRLHRMLGIEKSWILRAIQIVVTFNLVSLAWIFFRANSLSDAAHVFSTICSDWQGLSAGFMMTQGSSGLMILLASVSLFAVASMAMNRWKECFLSHSVFRWAVYYSLIFSVIFLAERDTSTFLYMGF